MSANLGRTGFGGGRWLYSRTREHKLGSNNESAIHKPDQGTLPRIKLSLADPHRQRT